MELANYAYLLYLCHCKSLISQLYLLLLFLDFSCSVYGALFQPLLIHPVLVPLSRVPSACYLDTVACILYQQVESSVAPLTLNTLVQLYYPFACFGLFLIVGLLRYLECRHHYSIQLLLLCADPTLLFTHMVQYLDDCVLSYPLNPLLSQPGC